MSSEMTRSAEKDKKQLMGRPSVSSSPSRVRLSRKQQQLSPLHAAGSKSVKGYTNNKGSLHNKGYRENAWKSNSNNNNSNNNNNNNRDRDNEGDGGGDDDDLPHPLFPSSAAEASHIAKAWKDYVRYAQQNQQQQQQRGDSDSGDIIPAVYVTNTSITPNMNSYNTSGISKSMSTSFDQSHLAESFQPSFQPSFQQSVQPLTTASVDALARQLCNSTGR